MLEAFKKKSCPERLAQIQAEHPDKRILSYYQDEARFGQHGTITRVWAKVGTRPRAIRQTQYDYLYVFSAVCPRDRRCQRADQPAREHRGDERVPGSSSPANCPPTCMR